VGERKKVILLVTGGRTYANRELLFTTLDAIHAETPVTLLLNGGADGADAHARDWASSRRVCFRIFHAHWTLFGSAAGPIRNSEMIAECPDLVVAFPGGRGTADCVRKARAKGIEVREVSE
jgi:hypothetical protein